MNNPRNACIIAVIMVSACLATAQEAVTEATEMVPEYVELNEMTVVGLSSLVSMKCNLIHQLWERFAPREKEITNIAIPDVALEVSYATKVIEIEGSEKKDYEFFVLVGLAVESTDDIPEGMTYKVVPAHRYAKFVHKGPVSGITETYNYIYEEWLPNSGQEYDWEACEVEWYDERFKIEEEDSEFDIYIPIK